MSAIAVTASPTPYWAGGASRTAMGPGITTCITPAIEATSARGWICLIAWLALESTQMVVVVVVMVTVMVAVMAVVVT